MTLAFRVFSNGVVALFDEAPGGGDPEDIGSARNRPAAAPEDWLANVYFHSSMDNMETETAVDVTVSHGSVATAGSPGGTIGVAGQYDYSFTPIDHVLTTHSLGYEPFTMVTIGGDVIGGGYIVQINASGAARFVSVYVTTTQVLLREWAQRGAIALDAFDQDYRVFVVKEQPAPSGDMAFEFNEVTGALSLARERFLSSRRYLQVVPGGSPLGLAMGRTIDLANGAVRFVAPDGTTYDPVPADTKLRFVLPFGSTSFGDSMAYDGSFTGDEVILVQAP